MVIAMLSLHLPRLLFLSLLVMNSMDFLPIDVMAHFIYAPLGIHEWRSVPTSDINTTFALAIAVWILMIYFGIKVKGFGGWIHELFTAPFGSKIWVWPANFLFNIIEYISKPLSHSLRLFGNMYAGEVIFLLLGLLASTSVTGVFFWSIIGRRLVHIPYSNCGATSICLHDVNGGVFIDGA